MALALVCGVPYRESPVNQMMTKREAKQAGRQAGINAASWVFDGNTTVETYRAYVAGICRDDEIASLYEEAAGVAFSRALEKLTRRMAK